MRASEEIKRLQAKLDSGDLHPDEPLFTLRGRDHVAARAVRSWANAAVAAGSPAEKTAGARELATLMEAWPVKRIPGVPASQSGELPPVMETAS